MGAVAVLAQGGAGVVFAQLGHAVHALPIQERDALAFRLHHVALMTKRAIDRIKRLVPGAALGNLGRCIDLVAGGASQRLMGSALEHVGRCSQQLTPVRLGLIGFMALCAACVVELLRAGF